MSHPTYQFAQNLIEEFHDEIRPVVALPPTVTAGEPFFEEEQPVQHDAHTKKRPLIRRVGIIGAGVGGLFAAMLLQECGIPYQILESSDRIGGRLYTWRFDEKPDTYAYYVRRS